MPEAFLPGYTQVSKSAPDDWDEVEPRLAATCAQHNVALVIGLPEYAGSQVYNSAVAIGPDGGILARHRKLQLFGTGETDLYTPGDEYVTFDLGGVRFGLLICYDIEFPEHARALARLGADVILVPTANMMPFTNVPILMAPARAAENGVTVVYANYCGQASDLTYTGLSTIAGSDGFALAAKGQGEGLCIAALPTDHWSEHNVPLSTQLSDLRSI